MEQGPAEENPRGDFHLPGRRENMGSEAGVMEQGFWEKQLPHDVAVMLREPEILGCRLDLRI